MARTKNGLPGVYNAAAITLSDEEGAAIALDAKGNTLIGAVPAGATMLTSSSGNVANASAVATLAGAAGKTTYITGFNITGSGATVGAVFSVTVTGLIGGTATYTVVASTGATVVNTPVSEDFSMPIPASTTNTSIVVTVPALGAGNTNSTVVATGFQI